PSQRPVSIHTRRCKCVPTRDHDCSEWVTALPLVALKLPSIDQLWSPRPTAGSLSAGVRLPTRQPRHTGSLHGAILGVRRHMHHSRHARGRSSRLEFEDVITVDLPDDGHVDRQYLRAVFRNPHHYLPARRRRSRYLDTPLRTRGEHPIARRAKQAGLLASISALVCAVNTAKIGRP